MKFFKFYRSGKLRLLIFTILLLIVSIICFYESYKLNGEGNNNDYTEEETINSEELFGNQNTAKENVQAINLVYTETQYKSKLSSYDEYLLAKIAMAEAEGETIEGKALVIMVVLNRTNDNSFPDTVNEVILQHNGDVYQFSPVASGRFYDVEPNDDCWKALDMVYNGWDKSQGALYFESCKDNNTWHSKNLELLFKYGGHRFYK